MSIKVKLYMSYLAMAFVPVILLLLLMLLILFASGKHDMRDLLEKQTNEKFNQALIYGELTYVMREDTAKLEDSEFVSSLQERLSDQWAGLIITREGSIDEVSPFLMELSPHENWQRIIDKPDAQHSFKLYRFTSHPIQFQYPDGSSGSVVLLHRTEPVPMFWHPLSMAIGLVIVCLTSLLLTYFVSRSIIRPIQSLRTAALHIKEGDLSHELKMGKLGKKMQLTEISQLGSAFEEMRIRLKQSIDQSLQYEENRKLLLSHITHDLKTPISAIKGYVEGIMDGIANTDEKRIRYMQTIYRKATDMDQLIDELFLYTKLDLQKVAYDFKVVDLNRYMEQFVDEQRFEMEKSGVQLQFTPYLSGTLLVAADPDKLNRVLANILNNSLKYMIGEEESEDCIISVEMREKNGFAHIQIDDTGPGIEKEDLPHIFEGFYRAEQSRNSETGGSGLGLAIVKQIVEGHGGFVWAESKEKGGARFCLMLPITTAVRTVNEHEEHLDH
ncbi:cell wall metabolism sensor histidine kinase WalK [Paenibacillus sp. L3-i20]|uniref:sensor histidine kinase n=1 Tax=Paenibacillus sp. L3-i20 TaxID=2905833 RepID=UPI001EDF571D|nr:HAMP domain-containing sensor histidine kinase [Paenibacillus sp. L3-i20]GKU78720.1 two-component sensor histidine kinase [Paenibacillus sp. L3-i20]